MSRARVGRLPTLDSMRGLAAISVLFWHCALIFPAIGIKNESIFIRCVKYTPLHIFWCGYEAVIFFFVLSGFVLALPFLDEKTAPYSTYLIKRCLRIYPPYIVAMLVAVFAKLYLYSAGVHAEYSKFFNDFSLMPIDWNLVVRQWFLINSFEHRYNPVIWSLVIEMRISILFPLIMWLVRRHTWKTSLSIAFFLIALSWAILLLKLFHVMNFNHNYFDTIGYIACFILGSVMAKNRLALVRMYHNFPRLQQGLFFILSLLLYTHDWWLIKSGLLGHSWPQKILCNSLVLDTCVSCGVAGLIIVGLSSSTMVRLLTSNPILFLGRVSYSLYLYHVICLISLLNILDERMPTYVILCITPILSLGVAIVGYYIVELPAKNLARLLINKIAPAVFDKSQ